MLFITAFFLSVSDSSQSPIISNIYYLFNCFLISHSKFIVGYSTEHSLDSQTLVTTNLPVCSICYNTELFLDNQSLVTTNPPVCSIFMRMYGFLVLLCCSSYSHRLIIFFVGFSWYPLTLRSNFLGEILMMLMIESF